MFLTLGQVNCDLLTTMHI